MILKKKKILIVDDYQPILETLKDILDQHYSIDTALDGSIAIHKIFSDHFDLIILDLMMPKINGFQVLDKINSLKKPILIFSGKPKIVESIHDIKNPFIQYLSKPFEKSVLYFQIEHLLQVHQIHTEYENHIVNSRRLLNISKKSIKEISTFFSLFELEKKIWTKWKLSLENNKLNQNLLKTNLTVMDNLFTNLNRSKKIFNKKLNKLINLDLVNANINEQKNFYYK